MDQPFATLSPDFRDMLGLLSKYHAEFLLIGGYALAAHGHPRNTRDIDVMIRPTSENAARVWRALTEFGAPMDQLRPDDFTKPDQVVQLGVPPLRIDLTTSLTGIGDFMHAWNGRLEIDVDGLKIPVLGRADLIRNKRATGRPQDIVDADLLEKQ